MVEQLAAAGLVQPPLVHPGAEEVQLGLAHDPLQTQEQTVVEVGRVVQAIVVAQQRPEQAARAHQGDPVRVVAGQATGVLSQKDADMIKAEFREDVLEASAALDRLSGASLVRVDDLDAVAGPAQRDGHVGQRILARGRLLVLGHLLGTRLADIDDGFPIEMMVADLGGPHRQQVGRHDDGARPRRWASAKPG